MYVYVLASCKLCSKGSGNMKHKWCVGAANTADEIALTKSLCLEVSSEDRPDIPVYSEKVCLVYLSSVFYLLNMSL